MIKILKKIKITLVVGFTDGPLKMVRMFSPKAFRPAEDIISWAGRLLKFFPSLNLAGHCREKLLI